MMSIHPLLLCILLHSALALQIQEPRSRRRFLGTFSVASSCAISIPAFASNSSPSLDFHTDAATGIQWADAKIGTGPEVQPASLVSVDYVLSTTGARYGSKIYATADKGAPYRWKLGDGSTIAGLEKAIVGSGDIPPMRPGGIRRIEIPSNLAYTALASSTACEGIGPIPPAQDAFEEFQRFKNIYCNPNRAYQPDVVIDVKLYGKRTTME